jgi:uncharacterized protein YggE
MLRKSFIILVGLLMVALLAACAPQVVTPSDQPIRQMSVSGQGEVYLTPDIAYVNIGVHSQAANVADALRQNNAQSQAVARALKEMGVDEKDIQTSAFNVFPQQMYGPNGEMTGTEYVVDNVVFVTVRDLSKLGELLDAVVRSGANTINSVSFDVTDKSAAISQARKQAIDKAKATAQEIADAAGIKLGNIISLNTYVQEPTPAYLEGKGGAMMPAAPDVPMAAGQLILRVNADISYEIK